MGEALSGFAKKGLAVAVLLAAAYLLLRAIIGAVLGILWIVVLFAAVIGVLWAWSVLSRS